MTTIKSHLENIIALCDQADHDFHSEPKILPTTALHKIKIKAEKALNKHKTTDAILCEFCKQFGDIDGTDLTIELGSAIDE